MSKLSIVIICYKIPFDRLQSFLDWNCSEILDNNAMLHVVCDPDTFQRGLQELHCSCKLRMLSYTNPMPEFSISKTANFGIRQAILEGANVVVKSDVDVVFDGYLEKLLSVTDTECLSPRYRDVPSYERRNELIRFLPQGNGTISMQSTNWCGVESYDERCRMWGYEDNELVDRVQEMGLFLDTSGTVAHISHPQKWNRDSGFNKDMGQYNSALPKRETGNQPEWGLK